MSKIEDLKRLYEASTQRKWEVLQTCGLPHVVCLTEDGTDVEMLAAGCSTADAEFIALSHELMPQLLAAADKLRIMVEVFNKKDPEPIVAFAAIEQARHALEELK